MSCHSLIALHSNAEEPSALVGLDHSWGHLEPEHLEHLEAGREHRDIVITNPFWKVVRKIINTGLKKDQDTGGHFSQRGNSREARLSLLGDALRPLHHLSDSDQRTLYVRLWRKHKVRGSIFKWQ